MKEMTCRDCNWLNIISVCHLRKGQRQTGVCKLRCERVYADDEACNKAVLANEFAMNQRYGRFAKK